MPISSKFLHMKIERINENQIKCTLNRSDLASHQIRMSELVYGTEKTKGLFQDMMELASNEVGFDANDLPLVIEAIPVSMDCIVLMITKVEDPEEVDTHFSALTHLNDLFRDGGLRDAVPAAKEVAPIDPEISQAIPAATTDCLYSFADLDTVIDFAHHSCKLYQGSNTLYKNQEDGRFFLLLSPEQGKLKEFAAVCTSALEYGRKEPLNYARRAFLQEHYEQMLPNTALQNLSEV